MHTVFKLLQKKSTNACNTYIYRHCSITIEKQTVISVIQCVAPGTNLHRHEYMTYHNPYGNIYVKKKNSLCEGLNVLTFIV